MNFLSNIPPAISPSNALTVESGFPSKYCLAPTPCKKICTGLGRAIAVLAGGALSGFIGGKGAFNLSMKLLGADTIYNLQSTKQDYIALGSTLLGSVSGIIAGATGIDALLSHKFKKTGPRPLIIPPYPRMEKYPKIQHVDISKVIQRISISILKSCGKTMEIAIGGILGASIGTTTAGICAAQILRKTGIADVGEHYIFIRSSLITGFVAGTVLGTIVTKHKRDVLHSLIHRLFGRAHGL